MLGLKDRIACWYVQNKIISSAQALRWSTQRPDKFAGIVIFLSFRRCVIKQHILPSVIQAATQNVWVNMPLLPAVYSSTFGDSAIAHQLLIKQLSEPRSVSRFTVWGQGSAGAFLEEVVGGC